MLRTKGQIARAERNRSQQVTTFRMRSTTYLPVDRHLPDGTLECWPAGSGRASAGLEGVTPVITGDAKCPAVVTDCRLCGRPILDAWAERAIPRRFCRECRAASRPSRDRASGLPASEQDRDFHATLRQLMALEGYTIRGLARHVTERIGVPLNAATLGAWHNGLSLPADPLDSAALRALELALELELGDLALLFPPPEPATQRTSRRQLPEPSRPLTDYAGVGQTDPGTLQEAAARLQAAVRTVTGCQRVIVVELDSHHHVGVDRRPQYSETTLTVRAMHDLVDCYWFVHAFTEDGTATVHDMENCQVVRRLAEHPQLSAVELVFPRSLSRGDYHTFKFRVDYRYRDNGHGPRDEPPFFARAIPSPLETANLHVSFDVPPLNLYECRWHLQHIQPAQAIDRRPLQAGTEQARLRLTHPVPAAYGWIWNWPPPETLDSIEQSGPVVSPGSQLDG